MPKTRASAKACVRVSPIGGLSASAAKKLLSTSTKPFSRSLHVDIMQCYRSCEGPNGSSFRVHDQGGEETCTSHAATAVHELLTGRRYVVEDLLTGAEADCGSTMDEMTRVMRKTGQRAWLLQAGIEVPSLDRYSLTFRKSEPDLNIVKKSLSAGKPVVAGVTHFLQTVGEESQLTLGNSSNPVEGKHSIVITGFTDLPDGEGGGVLHVLNSHGVKWGGKGAGTISYGFFLAYAIEIHLPVLGKRPI